MSYASWSPSQVYSVNDVVLYSNIIYVSSQSGNLNNIPPTSPTWWMTAGGGLVVNSVNGTTGNLTFNGSGVSQVGQTFTFSGGGGGGVSSVTTTANDAAGALNITPTSGAVVASLKSLTAPVAGVYPYPTAVAVDAYGRAYSLAGGAPLSGVSAGTGISITGAPDVITNTGVTSLNSQTGATTLQSSGGSITVTNPSAGVINIEGTSLSGYVPYTGATATLDLGSQNLITTGNCDVGYFKNTLYGFGSVTAAGYFANRINVSINIPSGNSSATIWTFSAINYDNGTYILNFNSGEGNSGTLVLSVTVLNPLNVVVSIIAGGITGGSVSIINNGTPSPVVEYSYTGHAVTGNGVSILQKIVITP